MLHLDRPPADAASTPRPADARPISPPRRDPPAHSPYLAAPPPLAYCLSPSAAVSSAGATPASSDLLPSSLSSPTSSRPSCPGHPEPPVPCRLLEPLTSHRRSCRLALSSQKPHAEPISFPIASPLPDPYFELPPPLVPRPELPYSTSSDLAFYPSCAGVFPFASRAWLLPLRWRLLVDGGVWPLRWGYGCFGWLLGVWLPMIVLLDGVVALGVVWMFRLGLARCCGVPRLRAF